MQHLSRLFTLLVNQLIADLEHAGKGRHNDAVKMDSGLGIVGLETVGAAYCEQTLYTGQDGSRGIRDEQLNRIIEKGWPSFWEIEMDNSLDNGHELSSDARLGIGKDGQ